MPGIVIVIFILFAVLIIVGAYFAHQQALKRQQELAALAGELGWSFSTDYDYSFDSHYPQFGCFQSGSDRYAYNLLTCSFLVGDASSFPTMSDYHYETQSTDKDGNTTHHDHSFSFLVVDMPYANVPSLYIRREGFFDKIKRALGFDDIDF